MVQSLYEILCGKSQFFEIVVRHLYYGLKKIKKTNLKITSNKTKKRNLSFKFSQNDLIEIIKSLGIEKNDILIVHSSMDSLSQFNIRPNELIDGLIGLVGRGGTLCMPVFPIFKKNDRYIDEIAKTRILTYDVKKAPCWTGMLPNIFLRYPGVYRSEFPSNPLAATGMLAYEVVKDNLLGKTPHGKNSSWEFCVNHDAKILYLGCPMYHSLTIMHIREDLDDAFPVRDWYKKQMYRIKNTSSEKTISVYERRQFWSRYFTEVYAQNDLKKNNLAVFQKFNNLEISAIPSTKKLKDYLFSLDPFDFPFYKLPKKHDKRINQIVND